MTKQTKVVYTAVFGNYDHVIKVDPDWDCDFICFTDNASFVANGWQVVIVKLNGDSPAQANRRYKMLTHKYLQQYELSLYVDGNISLVRDPSLLFKKYLDNGIIAIPKHEDRDCAYKEMAVCIKTNLVDKKITEKQMAKYSAEGFPEKFGLNENSVIFRRHLDPNVIDLMEAWWEEYCSGGRRDQICLPYLLWKHQINVLQVVEGPLISNKFFKKESHAANEYKSFIARLALEANRKKHLNYYHFVISQIVLFIVVFRDKFFKRNH